MKKRIRERITNFFVSKNYSGVLIALLLALSLWLYANLNMEFTTFIPVPLEVKLPESRALETSLPSELSVQVRGSGWQLINLRYFNSSARCFLDLTKTAFNDSLSYINRNDLIKSVQSLNNTQAIDTDPQTLSIKTGTVVNYSIGIESRVKIVPRDGFCIVGEQKIKPDVINISGNEKILRNLNKWNTEVINFEDVYTDVNKLINLSDSLHNSLRLSQKQVHLVAEIQQEASLTFEDVEVRIKGGSLTQNQILQPTFCKVIVSGGVKQLAKVTPSQISLSIDINEINSDTSGILIPEVEVPPGIKVLMVEPRYLYHIKRIKS